MEQQFDSINASLDRIDSLLDSINSDVTEMKKMLNEMIEELNKYNNESPIKTMVNDGEIMFRELMFGHKNKD